MTPSDAATLDRDAVARIIDLALEEDIGTGDVTTDWTVRENAATKADLVARAPGVVAGLAVGATVFERVDPKIRFQARTTDGAHVSEGEVLAEVSGPARGVLTAERTALNFVQRMSGIATMTARYVSEVASTGARILDTRKTVPGLRILDKYAVSVGGGDNHRLGLWDMVLIKDNHIEAADGIGPAVFAVRSAMAREGKKVKVEVEVKTPSELEDALMAGVDWVMLDNMELEAMRQAVSRVREMAKDRPRVGAAGNVNLGTVKAVAETGVDLISVGGLTHSVAALDLSLLFRP